MLAPAPRGVCTELRGSSSTNNTCLPCPRPSKDRKYENNTHSSVCIFYTRFPRANTRTIIQIQSSLWYWWIPLLQTGICTYVQWFSNWPLMQSEKRAFVGPLLCDSGHYNQCSDANTDSVYSVYSVPDTTPSPELQFIFALIMCGV